MKKQFFLGLLLIFAILSTSFGQDNTQVGLPEGAIACLGKGGINIMRFSPDGTHLAVGTDVGVWLYDVEDGKGIAMPRQNIEQVNTLAFSSDGKLFASSGYGSQNIELWNTETGRKHLHIRLPNRFDHPLAIQFSKDNKILTRLGIDTIKQWDVDTGKILSKRFSIYSKSILALTPDGKSFVSGNKDNSGGIHIWDVATGLCKDIFNRKVNHSLEKSISKLLGGGTSEKKVWRGVQALALSPDGKTIVSAHDDNSVRLWDMTTRTELITLKEHTEMINAVAFSPDNTTFASGSADNKILLWNRHKPQRPVTLTGHKAGILSLVFAPDGKTFASGSADGTVRFWDIQKPQEYYIFTDGHSDSVKAIAFSTDGNSLAAAALNGTVQIWNTNTKQQSTVPPIAHYDITVAMAFSSDATLFVSNGADAEFSSHGPDNIGREWLAHDVIRAWILPTGDELTFFQQSCKALAFSPDNRILAASDTNKTRLWDVKTGTELFKLDAKQFFTNAVAFSHDGTTLATGGGPGIIHLWNVKTGSKLATLTATFTDSSESEAEVLAFSPDDSTLAVSFLNHTLFWDMKTRQETYKDLTKEMKSSDILTFSPDGKTLLTTSSWGWSEGSLIHLYNIINERKIKDLSAHTEPIESLVFSHDGKTLASGSQDGTVLLWDWEKITSKARENKGK